MAVYLNDDTNVFKNAVESILNNSVQPDQFIIVVDGPIKKECENFLQNVSSEYPIKLIRMTQNGGLANALNAALPHVSSEWIIRADADDISLKDRIKEIRKALRPELDVLTSHTAEVDESGKIISLKKVPIDHSDIVRRIKFRNPVNHNSCAIRTKTLKSCQGYPNLYLKEDYGLWIKMISNGARLQGLDKVLVRATVNDGFYKRKSGLKFVVSEMQLQKLIYECGQNTIIYCIIAFIVRIIFISTPAIFKKPIYRKMLRDKK
jgi:cellulose synthase/poly-beta-1,6-N-acetylglucosamine synthase-like glycosyltransferase